MFIDKKGLIDLMAKHVEDNFATCSAAQQHSTITVQNLYKL